MFKIIILILILNLISISEENKNGDYYFNKGYYSENELMLADSLFNLAIKEYSKSQNQIGLVKSYYYKGMSQYHLGNLEKAIFLFTKSKIAAKNNIDFIEFYIRSNSQIIYILHSQNYYNKAMELANENLDLLNNISKYYNLYNIVYFDFALINYKTKNYKKSKKYLDSINLTNEDNHIKNITYNLKGLVFQELNEVNKSLDNFYKALEYSENDEAVLMNLIRFFYKTNQKDALEKYYSLYKSLYINENKNIVNLNNSLIEAEMFYYLGKYENSLEILNEIDSELVTKDLVKNLISCIDLKIKNKIALGEIDELAILNEKKDSLNNILLQQNLNISAEIISTIDKLEYENELLEIENQNAKINIALLGGLVLFLIVSIFSLIKYYYSRKDNFRTLFDMYIHLNTLNMLFKNRFSNILSRNQKNLLLNYDLDEDEELFLTHDELVKVNISMQQTIDKTTNELLTNKNSKDMMKEYSINMN